MSSLENLTEEQKANLAESMHKLLTNPELRKPTLQALKKADPKASFPELELDERISAASESQAKRIKELEDKIIEADLRAQREKQHEAIRAQGLDPLEVEKFARENGGMTYEAATKFMLALQASAPATPSSISPISMIPKDNPFFKDPIKAAREEAHKVINELRSKRAQGPLGATGN